MVCDAGRRSSLALPPCVSGRRCGVEESAPRRTLRRGARRGSAKKRPGAPREQSFSVRCRPHRLRGRLGDFRLNLRLQFPCWRACGRLNAWRRRLALFPRGRRGIGADIGKRIGGFAPGLGPGGERRGLVMRGHRGNIGHDRLRRGRRAEVNFDIDGFWRSISPGAWQGDQKRQEDGKCDQMNGASANRENRKIWSIAFAHGGGWRALVDALLSRLNRVS